MKPPPLQLQAGPFTIPGLEIGHAVRPEGPTGCTVLVFKSGARAACDVRGGAPGTREAAALDPTCLIPAIHGLLLTGGSAFGLDATAGVLRSLEEQGCGFPTPAGVVPIVPAAVIYDLAFGDPAIRPDAALGYRATEEACAGGAVEGNVGAGLGATVGKILGATHAMKGGLGMASVLMGGTGYRVGALAVVNAFGDVCDPATAEIVAGARLPDGGFADTVRCLVGFGGTRPYADPRRDEGEAGAAGAIEGSMQNTTLVAVVTDAPLGKPALARVAAMAHDGMARAVRPCHTQWDGDVVYAASTTPEPDPMLDGSAFGAAAVEAVALAVLRGVTQTQSLMGTPAAEV